MVGRDCAFTIGLCVQSRAGRFGDGVGQRRFKDGRRRRGTLYRSTTDCGRSLTRLESLGALAFIARGVTAGCCLNSWRRLDGTQPEQSPADECVRLFMAMPLVVELQARP